MVNKKTGGKATNNSVKSRRKAMFDKNSATLVRVVFKEAGMSPLPNSLSGRCWLEWEPRLDASGPDKRCFYSKVGKGEWDEILGESGTKLPRNGASLDPKGRIFMVLFPGTLKIWKETDKKMAGTVSGQVETFPASVNSETVRSNAIIAAVGGGYAETVAESSRAPSRTDQSRGAASTPGRRL